MLDNFISIPLQHAGLVSRLLLYKYKHVLSSNLLPGFRILSRNRLYYTAKVTRVTLCKNVSKLQVIMGFSLKSVTRDLNAGIKAKELTKSKHFPPHSKLHNMNHFWIALPPKSINMQ